MTAVIKKDEPVISESAMQKGFYSTISQSKFVMARNLVRARCPGQMEIEGHIRSWMRMIALDHEQTGKHVDQQFTKDHELERLKRLAETQAQQLREYEAVSQELAKHEKRWKQLSDE